MTQQHAQQQAQQHGQQHVGRPDIEQLVRTRLRSLRHSLGLSLDDLAAQSNLGPSTISRIETGNRTISLDVLVPLARALHVDLDAPLDRQLHRDEDADRAE